MATITCKNCSAYYTGNYCPQCGQPADTHAINAHYFLHDIPHSIFHVDKGLLYTLRALFTRPGKMLKEYLAGKRVKHFRPFGYVVIMSTICTLLIKWIEKGMISLYQQYNPDHQVSVHHSFFDQYISLLIFILIPVLSLVTWLCFRKKQYNYWEHFLANTYMAAQLNVILLLIKLYSLLKLLITHELAGVNFTFFMVIFMFYYGFTFSYLMRPFKSRGRGIVAIGVMNFFLAFVYMTGFSLAGIMQPWWDFK